MTAPTNLPAGWTTATVGDLLLRIETGKSPRCDPRPSAADERGVIKVSAMTYGQFDAAENKALLLGADFDPNHEIRGGDLLLSRANTAAYVGAVVLVPHYVRPGLLLSDKSLRLVPGPGVNPMWLLYALRSEAARRQIEAVATGTKDSMRNISQDKVRAIKLMVPPAPEQQRIATALAAHISGVEAVQGAQELLTMKLAAARARILDTAIAGFGTVPLSELLNSPLSNGRSVRTRAGGFPVLRLTALREGWIDLGERKDGDWTGEEARPWLVEEGDFLVARGNGSLRLVGRGGLVAAVTSPVAYPDTLIRLRLDPTRCDPQYLRLVWDSRCVRRQIESVARTTAGIYKVNQKHLEAVELPLPDLQSQRKVVRSVGDAWVTIDVAQSGLKEVRAKTAALRRSLLVAAATGQLVGQDPSEEPAGLLIKRITEDRAAAPTAHRRRGRTVPSVREDAGVELVEESA